MGSGMGKAFPTPGVAGNGLGNNASAQAQAPALQPNLQPMPVMRPAQPLKPMSPSMGNVLQKGQAGIPTGQTAMNPWGANRGGSGSLPLYRRPGTMPDLNRD
jgi:hypothetical protein